MLDVVVGIRIVPTEHGTVENGKHLSPHRTLVRRCRVAIGRHIKEKIRKIGGIVEQCLVRVDLQKVFTHPSAGRGKQQGLLTVRYASAITRIKNTYEINWHCNACGRGPIDPAISACHVAFEIADYLDGCKPGLNRQHAANGSERYSK